MTLKRVASCVLIAFLLAVAPAGAQDRADGRFTMSGGAGVSAPFHGDLDFRAPSWVATARARVAPHFTIEGFVSEWLRSSETTRTDVPLTGPSGAIGSIGQLTLRTRYRTQSLGFNLLSGLSRGRVTLSAGGGAGLLRFQRTSEQVLSGCRVTGPLTCS